MRSWLLPALVVVLAGCASHAPTADSAPRSHGPLTDSNRGHPCLSGTELYIKLIGTFNIAVGDAAVHSISSASSDDYEVHAVLITVDAATGDECLLSVQTGTVRPDRGATVLFTR